MRVLLTQLACQPKHIVDWHVCWHRPDQPYFTLPMPLLHLPYPPPQYPPPLPLCSLPPPPPIILELFCCVPLIAQHTLSAVHDVWLVCRWVGPAPTLQRGVGRGVRATSTPQMGCPSAPATPWTLQKAERASLQVSSTFCIVIGLIYCVTTIPHCTKAGVQRCDRSDLVCLTVCLQQAVHDYDGKTS